MWSTTDIEVIFSEIVQLFLLINNGILRWETNYLLCVQWFLRLDVTNKIDWTTNEQYLECQISNIALLNSVNKIRDRVRIEQHYSNNLSSASCFNILESWSSPFRTGISIQESPSYLYLFIATGFFIYICVFYPVWPSEEYYGDIIKERAGSHNPEEELSKKYIQFFSLAWSVTRRSSVRVGSKKFSLKIMDL